MARYSDFASSDEAVLIETDDFALVYDRQSRAFRKKLWNSSTKSWTTGWKAPYSALVAKDGSTVWAEDASGKTIASGESGVDDASVIQSAIDNSEGLVKIARGTYQFSQECQLKDGIIIEGEGEKTRLVANTASFFRFFKGGSVKNVVIRNLYFDGIYNGDNVGRPVDLWDSEHCIVENLIIHNPCGYGIHLTACNYCTVRYNKIYNSNKEGIGLTNHATPVDVYGNRIIGNYAYGCYTNGIYADNHNNGLIVAFNICEYNGHGYGVDNEGIEIASNCEGVAVIGNRCFNNHHYGILLNTGINKSLVVGNQAQSIEVFDSHYVTVVGNRVDGELRVIGNYQTIANNVGGLSHCGGHNKIIQGNFIENSPERLFLKGSNIIVANNIFKNSALEGIRVDGPSDNVIIADNHFIENEQSLGYPQAELFLQGGSDEHITNVQIIGNSFITRTDETVRAIVAQYVDHINILRNNFITVSGDKIRLYNVTDKKIKDNINHITENSGTATFSGDGTTTQFSIAHGLVSTPTKVLVTPMSSDAASDFYVTADDTNIYINYKSAPPSGTDNLKFSWYAEV